MPTHLGKEIYPSKQFLEQVEQIILDSERSNEERFEDIKEALHRYEERIQRMNYSAG